MSAGPGLDAVLGSGRSCVQSFPTSVKAGLLFAWLEGGPSAEQDASQQVKFAHKLILNVHLQTSDVARYPN